MGLTVTDHWGREHIPGHPTSHVGLRTAAIGCLYANRGETPPGVQSRDAVLTPGKARADKKNWRWLELLDETIFVCQSCEISEVEEGQEQCEECSFLNPQLMLFEDPSDDVAETSLEPCFAETVLPIAEVAIRTSQPAVISRHQRHPYHGRMSISSMRLFMVEWRKSVALFETESVRRERRRVERIKKKKLAAALIVRQEEAGECHRRQKMKEQNEMDRIAEMEAIRRIENRMSYAVESGKFVHVYENDSWKK